MLLILRDDNWWAARRDLKECLILSLQISLSTILIAGIQFSNLSNWHANLEVFLIVSVIHASDALRLWFEIFKNQPMHAQSWKQIKINQNQRKDLHTRMWLKQCNWEEGERLIEVSHAGVRIKDGGIIWDDSDACGGHSSKHSAAILQSTLLSRRCLKRTNY